MFWFNIKQDRLAHHDLCACGRKHLGGYIKQEYLGQKHCRVHDIYECYEVKGSAKRTLAKRPVEEE